MNELNIGTIERRKKDLQDWFPKTYTHLEIPPVQRIRCLALGCPSDGINAQYQLAFLLLLKEKLGVSDVTVYDPIFQKDDLDLLRHYDLVVQKDHPDDNGTLWYIPHGPFSLVKELASGMSVYLGNDMVRFEPRVPVTAEDDAKLEALRKSNIKALNVDKKDRWFTAMNDMALHVTKS
ncbi:SRR1-like protein BER1 [Wickerhamiella sorbophila]|uniref:SRR1-like protein BER1 n=1 Tax=Wickerhamiella sorbophila TaxID=45607 RepID=A0A2T0FHF2_9ASCO|nr:SRR1-like protein BER1 [Wickerhamiella sorbophila]PRT54414.1 SRR1-like protein BER1 [Wickerhamiella sorbophila]